jgi:hypothetical protein
VRADDMEVTVREFVLFDSIVGNMRQHMQTQR